MSEDPLADFDLRARVVEEMNIDKINSSYWSERALKAEARVAELEAVLHMVGGILDKYGFPHALKQVRAVLAKGREGGMSELARERAIELEDECFRLRARVAELESKITGHTVTLANLTEVNLKLERKQCDCGAKDGR